MLVKWIAFLSLPVLLSSSICLGQDKVPARPILKVDSAATGPFGGQQSLSCLRVYSDGQALYARSWNGPATIVDKVTGKESRPEYTISVRHILEKGNVWELSSFLESTVVKRLPEKFDPPYRPIDYFDDVTVQIIHSNGKERKISTREFYVASLEEKSRYPSGLVVLMDKIAQIENESSEKGKPTEIPSDCRLKLKEY